jgi:hypothetical protein
MAHVKQDGNSLSINMLTSKALKKLSCFAFLCTRNYDKIAYEIWTVYDAEKQQLTPYLFQYCKVINGG